MPLHSISIILWLPPRIGRSHGEIFLALGRKMRVLPQPRMVPQWISGHSHRVSHAPSVMKPLRRVLDPRLVALAVPAMSCDHAEEPHGGLVEQRLQGGAGCDHLGYPGVDNANKIRFVEVGHDVVEVDAG